ncbi:MAG: sugar transferase [Acidimicrobiales bacterium]
MLLRQPRVGKDGTVFPMYKIRTMKPDRRLNQVPFEGPERRQSHKRDDDPRHTPVGRLLRKYSIDELPQFWNVLRGDMSLVGPRPELVSVVDRYDLWDHPRHRVKPGLTGPWQVSTYRSVPLHENMHLDIDYVREQSLRGDVAVLRATVVALTRALGS